MSRENVELVRASLEPFAGVNVAAIDWSGEELREAVAASYAEDAELRTLATGVGSGMDSVYRGWDGLVRYLREWFEPFSEYHVEWLEFIDDGDRVLVPSRQWGIGSASGARVELELTHAYTVRDGRIARLHQFDTLEEAREAAGRGGEAQPDAIAVTPRTKLRRKPKRGSHEREVIDAILDEALVSHLGVVDDAGHPIVTPTLHARVGSDVYVHGSAANRTLRESGRSQICLTTTLIDGLVLARAAMHHSANYRSVMLFGRAEPLDADDEKATALEAFTEKLVPGRWADVRPPSAKELTRHVDLPGADRGGLGEDPHRPADRRRRGPCAARLGGHDRPEDGRRRADP